jgi:NADH-quinone oxidoreductase subunit A
MHRNSNILLAFHDNRSYTFPDHFDVHPLFAARMASDRVLVSGAHRMWPLLVYFLLAIALTAAILYLSYHIGERHSERATHDPYESGMTPTGSARLRVAAEFYLVAMFFVIFDLESIFVVAWSVAVRETGWLGYIEVVIFVGILSASLLYLWRVGGLEWRTRRQREALRRRKELSR